MPDFVVQDGDPRGDGNGGPGYSIRDELNDLPYLRGTVGMALAARTPAAASFSSPTRRSRTSTPSYTVFGRVVPGMEVVDKLQQDDTIDRVRVWDGAAA